MCSVRQYVYRTEYIFLHISKQLKKQKDELKDKDLDRQNATGSTGNQKFPSGWDICWMSRVGHAKMWVGKKASGRGGKWPVWSSKMKIAGHLLKSVLKIFQKMDGALHTNQQCQGMGLERLSGPNIDWPSKCNRIKPSYCGWNWIEKDCTEKNWEGTAHPISTALITNAKLWYWGTFLKFCSSVFFHGIDYAFSYL